MKSENNGIRAGEHAAGLVRLANKLFGILILETENPSDALWVSKIVDNMVTHEADRFLALNQRLRPAIIVTKKGDPRTKGVPSLNKIMEDEMKKSATAIKHKKAKGRGEMVTSRSGKKYYRYFPNKKNSGKAESL